MSTFKNPLFWAVVSFFGGWIVGGIGWIKNDSTIASATHGAVFMIALGVAMILAGGAMFLIIGNRK